MINYYFVLNYAVAYCCVFRCDCCQNQK